MKKNMTESERRAELIGEKAWLRRIKVREIIIPT